LFATAGANGHEKNSSGFYELSNHEVVRHEKILKEFFELSNHEVVRLEKNSSEFFEVVLTQPISK
jgi:hypothetical protein